MNAPQNNDHLNETMLYKFPGPHEIHGAHFDYVIVPEADIEEAKAQGWHLTTGEAREAHDAAMAKQFESAAAPAAPAPYPGDVPEQDKGAAVADPVQGENPYTAAVQADAEHVAKAEEQEPAGQVKKEAAETADDAPATYDEMKTKAKELGLEFPGNISKAALLAMITAKLAEQG